MAQYPVVFGVEFELISPHRSIKASLERFKRHMGRRYDNWRAHDDCSVGARPNDPERPFYTPFELITPPLPYTPKSLQLVKQALRYLKKDGYLVNKTCGLHVHFSMGHLTNLDNFGALSLWLAVWRNERAFYNLFPKRRNNGSAVSLKKLSSYFNTNVYNRFKRLARTADTKELFEEFARGRNNTFFQEGCDRYDALNLTELAPYSKHQGRLRTVEFRYGAGTLNSTLALNYIRLCAKFYKKAIKSQYICYKDMIIHKGPRQYFMTFQNLRNGIITIPRRRAALATA